MTARLGKFDATAVPDRHAVFWANGYETTSTWDLAAQMGVIGASPCNAFDNKRFVLEAALHDVESKFFRRTVAVGQQDDSIGGEQPADDLARLPLGVLLGMRVLTRTRPQRALLDAVARSALACLKPGNCSSKFSCDSPDTAG